MASFEEVAEAIFDGDEEQTVELTKGLLSGGADPQDVVTKGLIAGMERVGVLFKNNEMFVPEVLMSAAAMNNAVEVIKETQKDFEMQSAGKVVMATVKGDLHDIGKNLVGMMMESNGYTVYNLGVDIEPDKFVEAVKENKPDILAMSALLTTTMMEMKATIDALTEAGLKDKVKVIIGGAPITQGFADEIGADGYAEDAASAIEVCKKLMQEKGEAA